MSSRRASCVWHPLPEDVQYSTVQSHRASLAEGRRKYSSTSVPDWEVDMDLNSADTPEKGGRAFLFNADGQPYDGCVIDADAAVGNCAADNAAYPTSVVDSRTGLVKTRYTLRFRGSGWSARLNEDSTAVLEAFLSDVYNFAGLPRDELVDVHMRIQGPLIINFCIRHPLSVVSRVRGVHYVLQHCGFPSMMELYLNPHPEQPKTRARLDPYGGHEADYLGVAAGEKEFSTGVS